MVTNPYQTTFWAEVRKALQYLENTPSRSPREAQLRAGRACRQLSRIANSFTPEPLHRGRITLIKLARALASNLVIGDGWFRAESDYYYIRGYPPTGVNPRVIVDLLHERGLIIPARLHGPDPSEERLEYVLFAGRLRVGDDDFSLMGRPLAHAPIGLVFSRPRTPLHELCPEITEPAIDISRELALTVGYGQEETHFPPMGMLPALSTVERALQVLASHTEQPGHLEQRR